MTHALSLLVAQHGEIVFERYYRDCAHDDLHSVHSVTKSFTSTLVGILVGDGPLTLDTPVTSLLAAPAFSADEAKIVITTDTEAVASPRGQPLLWLAIETIVPAFRTSHGQAVRDNKHAT